jgi:hypothetical protein
VVTARGAKSQASRKGKKAVWFGEHILVNVSLPVLKKGCINRLPEPSDKKDRSPNYVASYLDEL